MMVKTLDLLNLFILRKCVLCDLKITCSFISNGSENDREERVCGYREGKINWMKRDSCNL